ncbi:hypothetical protein HC928_17880 [bacterium]|nr:hypothetical protein [bacterium]
MTVIASWDNDDTTVLRYIHYGCWSWSDVDQAIKEAQAMLRTRRHTHVIIDLRESARVIDSDEVREKCALSIAPGRETEVVFVGPRTQARLYYSVMRHRYKGRRTRDHFHFTDDLDEARRLLPVYAET